MAVAGLPKPSGNHAELMVRAALDIRDFMIQYKEQRIEFGKFINNLNEKKTEEISSLKDEFSKDKTNFMEKTKKDFKKFGKKFKKAFKI